MSLSTEPHAGLPRSFGADFWKVPNQLTTLRFLLSIVLFAFLSCGWFLTSMVLFIIAAGTDWIDGYYARKYGQVTMLGRILDPFVDKIIICGTFILLGSWPGSGVGAWMAVVIVGRELLVTALRSFLETQGTDFSAKLSGKLKMVLQCLAAATSLFILWYRGAVAEAGEIPTWMHLFLIFSVWAAVLSTIQSGIVYIVVALRMLRQE